MPGGCQCCEQSAHRRRGRIHNGRLIPCARHVENIDGTGRTYTVGAQTQGGTRDGSRIDTGERCEVELHVSFTGTPYLHKWKGAEIGRGIGAVDLGIPGYGQILRGRGGHANHGAEGNPTLFYE